MSWSFSAAAKGSDVVEKVRAAAESAKRYSAGAQHCELVDSVVSVVEKFATGFPDKVIVVESTGHVDSAFGNLSITARVFPG